MMPWRRVGSQLYTGKLRFQPGPDFLPQARLLCPCGLGASRSRTIDVTTILLWVDFCPVSWVTYCKDEPETHLSTITSQPPVISIVKIATIGITV